jgi:hypothetical protein
LAEQQPDPAFMQRATDRPAAAAQRRARWSGRRRGGRAMLTDEVAKLKAEIEELKKPKPGAN